MISPFYEDRRRIFTHCLVLRPLLTLFDLCYQTANRSPCNMVRSDPANTTVSFAKKAPTRLKLVAVTRCEFVSLSSQGMMASPEET